MKYTYIIFFVKRHLKKLSQFIEIKNEKIFFIFHFIEEKHKNVKIIKFRRLYEI